MAKNTKVGIGGLSDAVMDILEEYQGDVDKAVDRSIKFATKRTVEQLKRDSPVGNSKKHYRDGWTSRTIKDRLSKKTIIFNTKGQMTHLLERGHVISNQFGGPYAGRTKAQPHIKPAEEYGVGLLERTIIKELNG